VLLTAHAVLQIRDMVAGLDYAFPNSPKIGALAELCTKCVQPAMLCEMGVSDE